MSALVSLLAQLVHIVLLLIAAPTVIGLLRWAQARLAHRTGPHPLQPWRDLTRLARKQAVLAENASPVFSAIPPACLAATFLAASLVPSFTLGMAFARLSDLLVLAGLLALARVMQALAALDPGTAAGGLAAARSTSFACLAEPAVFLVILTLGLLGGTTNLDLLVGLQREGMLQPAAASALALAAMMAVAIGDMDRPDPDAGFSATDLAMITFAEALRLMVWFDLIGAVFLPLGMAAADAGPIGWIVGVVAWVAKLAVLTAALAMLRHRVGRVPRRRLPTLVGVASVLGLLAAALVIASAAAA